MTSAAKKLGIVTLALGLALGIGAFFLLQKTGTSKTDVLPGRWLLFGAATACHGWLSEDAGIFKPRAELRTAEQLSQALEQSGARGVLFSRQERFEEGSVVEPTWIRTMRSMGSVPGFNGEKLSSTCAAYVKAEPHPTLSESEAHALEQVVRGIFKGEAPPQLSSFPAKMRRQREVELLVLVRLGGELRMWRSARRSSIASAVLTVAAAIRDRWRTRRAFMQQDLSDVADRVQIEIRRVADGGTLLVNSLAEVEDLVPPGFGVGVEHRLGWSYRLPEIVQRDPSVVTKNMLEDDKIDLQELGSSAPRLYRFRLVELSER